MMTLVSASFASCTKENGSGSNDNTGIEVRIINRANDGYLVEMVWEEKVLFEYYYQGNDNSYYGEGSADLGIDSYNNFYLRQNSNYITSGRPKANATIASIGSVRGLNKVNKIPQSGWTDRVAVNPGNGYVIRFEGSCESGTFCHYARVYVKEWIESTSGGIIGAIVRYETRQGKGKGNPEVWVAVVKEGKIMFEIGGVDEATAREAFRLASHKLPVRTKFIKKENGGEE